MKIAINGKEIMLGNTMDIAALLETQGYGGMLVAVAHNGTFVPKGRYAATIINDGDEIEIVSPMQGG